MASRLGGSCETSRRRTINRLNIPRQWLACASIGLLIAALLVPIIIAALGRADLAVCFSIVSALLALVLAAFSRGARLGKRVLLGLLLLLPLGGAASVAFTRIWRNRLVAKEEARSHQIWIQEKAVQQQKLREQANRASQSTAPATPK